MPQQQDHFFNRDFRTHLQVLTWEMHPWMSSDSHLGVSFFSAHLGHSPFPWHLLTHCWSSSSSQSSASSVSSASSKSSPSSDTSSDSSRSQTSAPNNSSPRSEISSSVLCFAEQTVTNKSRKRVERIVP
eukprot:CAMPEP_0117009896 /NCGR_PEP_ID=MMETSP0472-20121206/8866_1 /TAXON_ID=693140 ORGANISM="Tiarina fusus, Strain LIS" /NCGR_SAMPLE_ID=MMETSP0472 /ASSEMBLY_ACC=CAM_ASM_000603 /LENGTH=128 /DNA_ID=CAMNT_0004712303 /DNA_START=17 /DNA_END=400 /DNA_ORIENTATION=+